MEKPTTRSILSKLRLIHLQRAHLLLITMVLLFFQSDFPVQSYELLKANNTQVDFDRTWYNCTYNARKFWMRSSHVLFLTSIQAKHTSHLSLSARRECMYVCIIRTCTYSMMSALLLYPPQVDKHIRRLDADLSRFEQELQMKDPGARRSSVASPAELQTPLPLRQSAKSSL